MGIAQGFFDELAKHAAGMADMPVDPIKPKLPPASPLNKTKRKSINQQVAENWQEFQRRKEAFSEGRGRDPWTSAKPYLDQTKYHVGTDHTIPLEPYSSYLR